MRFFFILLFCFQIEAADLIFPAFDVAMCRGKLTPRRKYRNVLTEKKVNLAKDLYDQFVSHFEKRSEPIIPKVIHQIWLGSPIPDKFKQLMTTWHNMPGWQYILWTDESIQSLTLVNQKLFDESNNYAEKADILRYELLNQFGGLYVDVDFENLDPERFDALHATAELYFAIEPVEHECNFGNSIIGAIPHHPLIQTWVDKLEEHFYSHRDVGPVDATGPGFITPVTCDYYANHPHSNTDVILPASFVFPFIRSNLRKAKLKPMPETMAIHYWAASWKD